MPFISYARNSEDVLLWRAFRDVGAGFYVDVGANHPDQDSATRAFHDRGWAGINIEPAPGLARRIAQARPRDVTLALAAGASDGATVLHAAESAPEPLRVLVRRLSGILRDHAPDVVHFLRVDAPGAERAVIEGCDFGARRPWVILVQVTRPACPAPPHGEWEGLLLAAGYRFMLFDGLNRFYVADERAAALAQHFAVPVNAGDDYARVSDASWARRAAEQDALVQQATERAAAAQEAAHAAYSRAFEHARDLGTARAAVARVEQERDATREHQRITEVWARASDASRAAADALRDASEARVERLEAELEAFRRSTSWRITRPVRALASVARRPPRAPPPAPALAAPPPAIEDATPAPVALPPLPAAEAKPGLLRTVHQFHSGSATGDAVTNSMLLIRRRLRALGYRSEIFVQHMDPALADELRRLDDLPAHPDYVLIVHHSMGHDALDRILASPAPKVLHYHNITPAQFLPPVPALRRYGEAGREQLARLQSSVVAALAASEYNAIELRRAGFGAVAACSLLFDLDQIRAAAVRHNLPDQPVTILFVGRIIESKGQADLVDAFAQFQARLGRPARLMLVGRTDSPGEYLTLLSDRIRAHGLETSVVVTGPVPDSELKAQYAAADLYVSLSHHEGFGVPLVEAAVHGVPVLAWPCGAVPYTLPPAAGLLQSRKPGDVAERMLAVTTDADLRARLVQAQREAVDRFSLDRQWPAMQQALAMAGAAPPPDPAAAASLAEHLRFTVVGHAEGSYSLASINRALSAAIEAERPGQVRLVPFENGPTAPSRLPAALRPLAERDPPPTGPEVVISQHYPVHVPEARGDLTLALVFWEESLLPAATVAALNRGFDGVLAPSRFVAKALLDSGLTRPVHVIGQAPDLTAFEAVARHRVPDAGRPFTFLHVSSCFPRKGVDMLLQAYAAAFRRTDPVRLVIKGFPNPHNTVPEQVAALQARDPDAPVIEVINQDLDLEAMLDLYRDADAMVLPTRGEGLNLPAAEAMAAGLPLIVTGYGGHLDFCDARTARLLRYRLQPSGSHLATPGSLWAEPDLDDLAAALRDAAAHGVDAQRTGLARTEVALRLNRRAMVRRLSQASVELMLAPPQPPLRVAWITSWATRCGVAEYSRHLISAMPHSPAIASHVVLSDDRTDPDPGGQPRSLPAWDIGDHANVQRLLRAVVAEDPHVVVIQHQPGLIAWSGLAELLRSPVMTGRTVVATLHTTRELMRASHADQSMACAALGSAARVVVHTRDDLHQLQALGLSDNVTLVPHGVRAPMPRLGPPRGGADALIGCYGFFLPGKGIGELIQAVGVLRRRRPGARLRLVNAEYGDPVSAAEIARCRALAAEAGLGDAVEWETRFLPDEQSVALLAQCDVIAIPTQASRESSSAAVRTALSAGPPVIVTPLPLFDDVGDAVTRSHGTTQEELAQALDDLLSDPARREQVQAAAGAWVQAHGWAAVAVRMQGLLIALSVQPKA